MTITRIFKVDYISGLNVELDPRIFFDKEKAFEYARRMQANECDPEEGEHVMVYEEAPDAEIGCFRTVKQYDMRKM